jgi:hypothetical protein
VYADANAMEAGSSNSMYSVPNKRHSQGAADAAVRSSVLQPTFRVWLGVVLFGCFVLCDDDADDADADADADVDVAAAAAADDDDDGFIRCYFWIERQNMRERSDKCCLSG